jgi:hypothetical protein
MVIGSNVPGKRPMRWVGMGGLALDFMTIAVLFGKDFS